MRSTYTKPVCRGSWALGTACGKCERCEETRPITATVQAPSPIHAATLSTIRQQIARIPAGPGRSADEFKEDLRRTLDCMEVAETLETPAEPLRLREGGYYRRRDGKIEGPINGIEGEYYIWTYDGMTWDRHGNFHRPAQSHNADLIIEVPAPTGHLCDIPGCTDLSDTILTPTVPVTVDRNTQIVDPDTGCLTELGAALWNGLERRIG